MQQLDNQWAENLILFQHRKETGEGMMRGWSWKTEPSLHQQVSVWFWLHPLKITGNTLLHNTLQIYLLTKIWQVLWQQILNGYSLQNSSTARQHFILVSYQCLDQCFLFFFKIITEYLRDHHRVWETIKPNRLLSVLPACFCWSFMQTWVTVLDSVVPWIWISPLCTINK